MPCSHTSRPALALFGTALLIVAAPLAAQAGGGGAQPSPTRQAQRLDTEGKHTEARALFQRLIDEAMEPAARAAAQRRMAMSWAFEGNCAKAIEYETQVIAYWATREAVDPQDAFYQQGEMANEAARICIDAGFLDEAEQWYRKGSELGLKEPDPKTHPKSLWDFRLAHASARIAAQRGNKAEAERQVAVARSMLDSDSAMASQQARFYPYLVGYVALFTGNLTAAQAEFTRALAMQGNQNDPFTHYLLGLTHEKMGHPEPARALYQKAYDFATGHNPPAAFTRPNARKKLGAP